MSVQTRVETPSRPVRPAAWDRLHWALIAVWVVLVATGLVVGHRSSTLRGLEDGIASGRVPTVYVAGGLSRGADGFATQQVRWRSGLLGYEAAVLQASRHDHPYREGAAPGSPVLRTDVGAYLVRNHPGLHVVRGQLAWSGSSMLGRELPGWMGSVGLLAFLATLVLMIAGPRPHGRRLTGGWAFLLALVLRNIVDG